MKKHTARDSIFLVLLVAGCGSVEDASLTEPLTPTVVAAADKTEQTAVAAFTGREETRSRVNPGDTNAEHKGSTNLTSWCSCVQYVQNRTGLSLPGSAKDAGPTLERKGYRPLSGPQVGALAVMQPSFPGADGTHGHISYVSAVSPATTHGANQGGSNIENNCNDVNDVVWGTPFRSGDGRIAFYGR